MNGAFVARIRIDRVDALSGPYRALPIERASALIVSATELLGRVVRDRDLVAAARDASRPAACGVAIAAQAMDDHPAVWRAAVVALGLVGVTPVVEDWAVARAQGEYDRAAVILRATLSSPRVAAETLAAFGPDEGRTSAVVLRRLTLGRLMTVVG